MTPEMIPSHHFVLHIVIFLTGLLIGFLGTVGLLIWSSHPGGMWSDQP